MNTCPRCLGPIPTEENPGAYPGARSRVSDIVDIEVCSACGTDEAVRDQAGTQLGMMKWPLRKEVAHQHVSY